MNRINKSVYRQAVDYVRDKNSNIWTIVIKYVSEGTQFKLAEKLKQSFKLNI